MKHFIGKIYGMVIFLMTASMNFVDAEYNNLTPCEMDECCGCTNDCCEGNLLITGDFLYWRAFESGLDLCVPSYISETTENNLVMSRFNGKSQNPHFRWDPGFRLGLGIEAGCNWDIAALWTHFHTHSHRSNQESEISWKINFDVIDILAGYYCELGSCFSLRPFLGLRGARINQQLHQNKFPLYSPDDPISIARNNKEDFSGLGPLLGLEFDWEMGCGFSFFANASISWLYGNFDIKLNEFDITDASSDFCRIVKHPNANLAAADAALGLRWRTCFCSALHLIIQLGLEHHRYFDYNRFGNYGDLSFDGANFSAGIEF